MGVVVVEGVKADQPLNGWIMEDRHPDRPQGGVKDYRPGDTVIKYGVDIGRVVQPIARGEHLHVHNVKTKRW